MVAAVALCETTTRASWSQSQSDSDQTSRSPPPPTPTGENIAMIYKLEGGLWAGSHSPSFLPFLLLLFSVMPCLRRKAPRGPKVRQNISLSSLALADDGQRCLERPTATSSLREGPDAPLSNSPRSLLLPGSPRKDSATIWNSASRWRTYFQRFLPLDMCTIVGLL
jgi:hypothetical protein